MDKGETLATKLFKFAAAAAAAAGLIPWLAAFAGTEKGPEVVADATGTAMGGKNEVMFIPAVDAANCNC